MTTHIPTELRRLVADRANNRCEYCLINETDTFLGCQIDHIIAEKHGGKTDENNLAFACTFCNRFKGTDIGSIAGSTGEFTRLYNPRTDTWADHFYFEEFQIQPKTPIAEATCAILRLNHSDRVLERRIIADSNA